ARYLRASPPRRSSDLTYPAGSIIFCPLAPPAGTRRPRRRGPPSACAVSLSTSTPRRAYPAAAPGGGSVRRSPASPPAPPREPSRSEEHTSELQSPDPL